MRNIGKFRAVCSLKKIQVFMAVFHKNAIYIFDTRYC